jgi:U3 small nucleolar RNA-associated protein 21
MDSTLRVWDVVAAQLLDAMKLDVPITALSLSPGMDMLATTHANRNGIYLW